MEVVDYLIIVVTKRKGIHVFSKLVFLRVLKPTIIKPKKSLHHIINADNKNILSLDK